jgi:hypothetical protein
MPTNINMREVTDRVLGMIPPSVPSRVRRRGPDHRGLAAILLGISALATLTSLGLLILDHAMLGLRVFCGSILLLLIVLRLR